MPKTFYDTRAVFPQNTSFFNLKLGPKECLHYFKLEKLARD